MYVYSLTYFVSIELVNSQNVLSIEAAKLRYGSDPRGWNQINRGVVKEVVGRFQDSGRLRKVLEGASMGSRGKTPQGPCLRRILGIGRI